MPLVATTNKILALALNENIIATLGHGTQLQRPHKPVYCCYNKLDTCAGRIEAGLWELCAVLSSECSRTQTPDAADS